MSSFRVIPAIDLLDGQVVRLFQGDFSKVRRYGDPMAAVERWQIPMGETLHLVDLEASREGKPKEVRTISKLARLGYQTQVGGGVRSIDDARLWLDAGASRVVIGTLAAQAPAELAQIVDAIGPDRILPAVDVRDGVVRIAGWEETSTRSVPMVMETLRDMGLTEVIVTDISRDGTLLGPSFDLYRDLASITNLEIIASGGVGTLSDVGSLARLDNVSAAIVGRALHDRAFSWAEADSRAKTAAGLAPRLLSRIRVENGRVASSLEIPEARDSGSVEEVARRLEGEGADGIYLVDDSVGSENREASRKAIASAVTSVAIPTVAGGSICGMTDVRAFLDAGAQRVLTGELALDEPDLVHAASTEFGRDALVAEVSARRSSSVGYRVVRSNGEADTAWELGEWAMRLEALGVGEILVSAVPANDDDSSPLSALVRKVVSSVRIPVVAAPRRARPDDIRVIIESGGASGVLVDSRIPDRTLSIPAMKRFLTSTGIPVRGGHS